MTEPVQDATTQPATIGELPGAQTAPQVPVVPQTEVTDPLYDQYHRLAAERGETGSLNGQYREFEANGKKFILRHPGIKQAMKTVTLAFQLGDNVPPAFNAEYVNALIKSTVVYPDVVAKQGIDYFDDHGDEFEAVFSNADDFLSKPFNS